MPRRKKNQPVDLPYRINPTTGCHEYLGSLTDKGYGQITINGRRHLVHRLIYEKRTGRRLPDNVDMCHTCDNPPCFLFEHLFEGSRKDNIRDASKKGRLKGRVSKKKGNWRGGRPRKN